MSLVYVFAASKQEGQPVEQITGTAASGASVPGVATPRAGVNELVLIIGGMGPKAARAKAQDVLGSASLSNSSNRAAKRKPDAVLVIGLCGALTDRLPETRIVTYTGCLSTEPGKPPLNCSAAITHRLLELLASRHISCEPVVAITSPLIAVTRNDKLVLGKRGASVVDMESYEIMSAAAKAGVPAAALRVVSDSLDRTMPDFNQALNEVGALDGLKAFEVALTSPIQTWQLIAANKRAMQYLGKALEIVLPADCFSQTKS